MSGWVPAPPRGARGRALRLAMRARAAVVRDHRRHVVERVGDLAFGVPKDVFNPVLFRSGAVLHAAVRAEVAVRGARVLDLGTGCGVGAVTAARAGAARVVAVDVNPAAVAAARNNARRHGVDDVVEVRLGDLFAPVHRDAFDLVLFNPPFFRGAPSTPAEAAWRGTDVIERFAAGLPAALAAGGCALVVLSTDGACRELPPLLERAGFGLEEVHRRCWPDEIELVLRARLPDLRGGRAPSSA